MSAVLFLAASMAAIPVKGEVVTHANLTVYPIYESPVGDAGDYISLDEGLKQGSVVITETGGNNARPLIRNRNSPINRTGPTFQNQRQAGSGATVNTLWLTNKSGKKLLILTGEMVSGGKQDRIIQKDVLIPTSKEPVNVSVFCVEQNRWAGNEAKFAPAAMGAGGLADPSVRGRAQHERSQGAVWGQVDASLSKLKTDNSTKTYGANLNSPVIQKSADSYVQSIQKSFPLDRAVGVAVAVNGKMVWMDRFANNQMFRKYWPKMIKSYALEAMQAIQRTPSPKPPTYDEAMRYADARDGKMTHESEDGVWKLVKIESAANVIYELEDSGFKKPLVLHSSKMAK